MSNGNVEAATLANCNAGWNFFLSHLPLQVPPCELVVASYKTGIAHSVTALTVETQLGTQRRRQSRLRT